MTNAKQEFLVQGSIVASGQFNEFMRGEPDIKPISQIARDVVTVEMTPQRAEALKQQFDGLVVEQNAPLAEPEPVAPTMKFKTED